MNIVHVVWSLAYGGAETLLIQLLNHQCKDNQVSLIIVNDAIEDDLKNQIDKRVIIHAIKRSLKSKNPIPLLRLSGLFLTLKSDIIHFHQDNLIEYIPVHFFKKNLCLTIHSVAMDIQSLYKYDHLFAISRTVQKQIKINTGIEAILIYNGINISEIRKKDLQERHPNQKFRIIQIGRLNHSIKGQHLLVEAAALLIKTYQFKNFHITLIGDGDSKTYLDELINKLNLQEYIHLDGSRSQEYIHKHLHTYDLLVQPSLYEGFGLSAIEALAANVPVLTSDVEGLMEVIQQEAYGYCFRQNNVEDLAKKLWEISNKPQKEIEELSLKAYQYVCDSFDVFSTSKNYLKAYQNILKK